MEKDNYVFVGDSYIEIQSSEKQFLKFSNVVQDGKVVFVLSTNKFTPFENPICKINEKNLKK